MEQYSHDQFNITGFAVIIPNKSKEIEVINQAWIEFDKLKLNSLVEPKAYPSLHAVYFNTFQPQLTSDFSPVIGGVNFL